MIFIERWPKSSASERANKDSFLAAPCDAIAVPAMAIKWPAKLPAQIALVRNLVTRGDASRSIEEVASQFQGARRDTVESVLDSLAALGLLVAYGTNGTRRWTVADRAAPICAKPSSRHRRRVARITR